MIECIAVLLGFAAIGGIPVFIVGLLFKDWHRAERIEESLKYDPEPIHGQGRFASPEDLRKAGW